jgi:hypothetical protein
MQLVQKVEVTRGQHLPIYCLCQYHASCLIIDTIACKNQRQNVQIFLSINIEYYNNIKLKQNYKNENLIPGNQLLPIYINDWVISKIRNADD